MTAATPIPALSTAPRVRRRRHLHEVGPAPVAAPVIVRERLLRRLHESRGARIALLRAPAGYGKTVLLEQWAREDPRRGRWLRAGSTDVDVEELGRLADACARRREPVVVIVDADRLGSRPALGDALVRLADGLPVGSLLVVSTRGAAPPSFARLALEHAVLELGARDLAMTRAESVELLDAAGAGLDAAHAEALAIRLEGWPAAIALAGRALACADAPWAAAEAFAGGDRLVRDYVRDEVVRPLPRRLASFLFRCSILDELDPELCDALLGGRDSLAALDELERCGVPLLPVAGPRGGLRCHPLLREALAAELDRREPAVARGLRLRAGALLEERGRDGEAVDQLLAAGAIDEAGVIIWRLAASWAWDERLGELERRLARIAPRALERRPALAGAAALGELARARFAHAARWVELARCALDEAPGGPARSLRDGIALLEVLVGVAGSSGAPSGRRRGAPVAPLPAVGDPWRPLACFVHGVAAMLAGDADDARTHLEDGVRLGIVEARGVASLCEAQLALAALNAGASEEGACLAERARGRIEDLHLGDHAIFAPVVAVAAFARAYRGRYEEARRDLGLLRRLPSEAGAEPAWYLAQTRLAAGRAELRLTDIAASRSSLETAARLARRLPEREGAVLRAWAAEGQRCASEAASTSLPGTDALTAAELRVLRFLPSHLSFREIGARLYVSPNTIKTQAHAVYRKLGASSRSMAVARAVRLGLIEPDGLTVPGP